MGDSSDRRCPGWGRLPQQIILIDKPCHTTICVTREDRVWIGTRNGVSLKGNGRIYPGQIKFRILTRIRKFGPYWKTVRVIFRSQPMVVCLARYTARLDRVAVLDDLQKPVTTNNIVMDVTRRPVTVSSGRLPMEGLSALTGSGRKIFNPDNGLANNNAMTLFEDSLGSDRIGTVQTGSVHLFLARQLRTLNTSKGLP